MLQNKIYQNFSKEILKTFFVILFGLTVIAWTVRAVNFLDLIVDSGYSIPTYFKYAILNLFGILTKFIPLSFLIALIIFIIKKIQDTEFLILWTQERERLEKERIERANAAVGYDGEKFFQQTIESKKHKLLRSKLMFVGSGRAGKTSLKQRLTGKDFDPNQKTTCGIELEIELSHP